MNATRPAACCLLPSAAGVYAQAVLTLAMLLAGSAADIADSLLR